MCEYERREPDRHDGHVVQVSVATHNIRLEVLNLHSLLFTGLLTNRSKVKPWLQLLHTVSFFHAAFEALAVDTRCGQNESYERENELAEGRHLSEQS